MAAITHLTLVASTVATATVTATNGVEVLNRSGAAEVYFRLDGQSPTVGGTDCFVLPAAIGSLVLDKNEIAEAEGVNAANTPGSVAVALISSGTPTVSVRGW